jgi:hypothetical protein
MRFDEPIHEGEEAEDEHGIDRETGWAGEFSERRRHV